MKKRLRLLGKSIKYHKGPWTNKDLVPAYKVARIALGTIGGDKLSILKLVSERTRTPIPQTLFGQLEFLVTFAINTTPAPTGTIRLKVRKSQPSA